MSVPAVGIDLGTTHSAIASATADGRARIIADARGARVHPSAVSFHPSGGVLVGADARARRLLDPENTVLGAKRLVGLRYGSDEVEQLASVMPLRLERGENDQVAIATRAGAMSVPEILAMVLDHLRVLAERRLESTVTRAVIAVPANFHDRQRAATITAGAIAGLDVPFLLNEPTAAAIAYGARRELHRVIAVYDFGGGTFDVSILELRGRVYEVLASAGDPFLGGDDIDGRIAGAMADAFLERERIDLRRDPTALSRLREAAETLKVELSWRQRAGCRLDAIAYGPGGQPLTLRHEMTRDDLAKLSTDLVERTFPVCDEALVRAGLRADQIGDVVLVGGTTKMPHVRQRVAQYFGRAARTDVDPDGAVALGAALQAVALGEGRGTAVDEGAPTLERRARSGAPAPVWSDAENTEISPADRANSTFGGATHELTQPRYPEEGGPDDAASGTRVDPLGRSAAHDVTSFHEPAPPAPGERLSGPALPPPLPGAPPLRPEGAPAPPLPAPRRTPRHAAAMPAQPAHEAPPEEPLAPPSRVLDVTSHSLKLVTVAGFCEPIIERGTQVPAAQTRAFTPAQENQQRVRIEICQGESRYAAENVPLGHLELTGLPPRPRAEAAIDVTFEIDASGLLRVVARDQQGREREVQLSLVGAPSAGGVARARERLSSLRGAFWDRG